MLPFQVILANMSDSFFDKSLGETKYKEEVLIFAYINRHGAQNLYIAYSCLPTFLLEINLTCNHKKSQIRISFFLNKTL